MSLSDSHRRVPCDGVGVAPTCGDLLKLAKTLLRDALLLQAALGAHK